LASEVAKKKSLRVALIASERTVGEYAAFLKLLLVGLADESIQTVLICPPGCDSESMFTGSAEIISHPVLDLPFSEHFNVRLLVQRLEKFEPTVIHCLCESKASLARHLARKMDLPYLLMVNSVQGRLGQFSISSRRCKRIVVSAKTVADNVAKAHPGFAEHIEQINIGTFVAETTVCFSQPNRIATMLTAHPFDDANDFENLFSVLRHLLIDGYEFMMVVAGDGRAERQLWKLLTALGLLQVVTMVPRLKPWRSVLAAGDIFIQPKPNLAFNSSLLEAMSVGAAIAGCKGGVDDLIIEDQTAIVFDPKDELSILRCLQRFLDKREFARKIAANAQEYLRENYSADNMISATIQAYRDALE
jgi:glycosyltransferase involved in cell wall biosynthesis